MNKKMIIATVCAVLFLAVAAVLGVKIAGKKSASEVTEPETESTVAVDAGYEEYIDIPSTVPAGESTTAFAETTADQKATTESVITSIQTTVTTAAKTTARTTARTTAVPTKATTTAKATAPTSVTGTTERTTTVPTTADTTKYYPPTSTVTEPISIPEKGSFTFSAPKLNGGTLNYSELSDKKVIMINAWEPWCGPCVNEMPDIERLYKAYKNKGFEVVGVCSQQYAADARGIVSSNGITYPVVFDGDPNFSILDSGYVPTTVFVDGNGHILSAEPFVGSRNYAEWETIINSYLK